MNLPIKNSSFREVLCMSLFDFVDPREERPPKPAIEKHYVEITEIDGMFFLIVDGVKLTKSFYSYIEAKQYAASYVKTIS